MSLNSCTEDENNKNADAGNLQKKQKVLEILSKSMEEETESMFEGDELSSQLEKWLWFVVAERVAQGYTWQRESLIRIAMVMNCWRWHLVESLMRSVRERENKQAHKIYKVQCYRKCPVFIVWQSIILIQIFPLLLRSLLGMLGISYSSMYCPLNQSTDYFINILSS